MVKKGEETSGQVAKIRRSSSETGYDYQLKFVLVGDSGTGKSAILQRFKDGVFTGDVQPTIGMDFVTKIVTLPDSEERVKVQLWDTAGQERYKSIAPNYFRGAHAVLVVFDVMRQETADHVPEWLTQAFDSNENAELIVLANKCDLAPADSQVCSGERLRDILYENQVYFNELYELSAKSGESVEKAITDTASEKVFKIIRDSHEGGHFAANRLADEEPVKKKCC